jgi:RNA polymerase sigma-70 factor, ECF subfamily
MFLKAGCCIHFVSSVWHRPCNNTAVMQRHNSTETVHTGASAHQDASMGHVGVPGVHTVDDMPEPEAIRLACDGDPLAFERLYKLHSRRVYALCLRLAGNPSDAEDLTQEAFLQLFRKIATFRGESKFSTWLHRLTVNVVLMRRRKKRHPEVSLDTTNESDDGDSRPMLEPGGPDLCLSGALDRVHLSKALEQLPHGYREMFILHDVEGYEHNEIAGILGCSLGNSKSQLFKARMRLRELLKEALRTRARERRESTRNVKVRAVPTPASRTRALSVPAHGRFRCAKA